MLKVGITGGIGSGKSVVSKILETFSYPVFYSDQAAKEIINNNADVKRELIQLFGEEMFKNNELNRPFLADIIFNNEEARSKVNAIIHPLVRKAFSEFAELQVSTLVFNEAAIIFETNGHQFLDKTILVTAPEGLRIARVIQRDRTTEEEVRLRMRQQWSDEEKIKLANYVLVNDEKAPLLEQIESLINQLSSS